MLKVSPFQVNKLILDAIMVFRSPRSDAITQAYNEDLELSLLELDDMDELNLMEPSLTLHLANEEIR